MAKDVSKEDEDDDKFEKMDDESLGYLDQVRKGRARNFLLSMKGSKVRSLIVKKKAIKDKDRKAARGEGFQPVFGVATGSGANITFTVARSDGFDEKTAECKTEKLKKFLQEQTGKACKPSFELVATPPPIPFDEDDLLDPLIARFMNLAPSIDQACSARPDSVAQIQTSVDTIRSLLQDDETRANAAGSIDDLEKYLAGILNGDGTIPEAPPLPGGDPTSTAPDSTATPAKKLAEVLKGLKPLVDKVLNAEPNRQGELHATMAQIAGEIKTEQFQQAKQNITDFAALLKSLIAQHQQTAPSTGDSINRKAEFTARRNALEARFLEAKRADPEKATKLAGVWDYAGTQADAANFDNALNALTRLEAAIDGVLASAPRTDAERFGIEEGIVQVTRDKLIEAFKKSKLVWERTRGSIQSELRKLEQAILDLSQQEEDYEDIQANSGNVYVALDELDDALIQLLDEAANTQDEAERTLRHQDARRTVQRYLDYLHNDDFLSDVDENPFATVKVRATLEASLAALNTSLSIRLAN